MLFDINDTEKLKPGTIKKALSKIQKYAKDQAIIREKASTSFLECLTPLMTAFNDGEYGDAIDIVDTMRAELMRILMYEEDCELEEIDRILYHDDDKAEGGTAAYISTVDEDDINDIF